METNHSKNGFTLIELLVVIAIIGIMASVVLASLSSARATARDSAKIQTIKQLQTALELYRTNYGNYPSTGSLDTVFGPVACSLGADSKRTDWIPNLVSSGTISILPVAVPPTNGCYLYSSDGNRYVLSAWNSAEGSYTANSNPLYSVIGYRESGQADQNCFDNHPNIGNAGFYLRSFTVTNISSQGGVSCND